MAVITQHILDKLNTLVVVVNSEGKIDYVSPSVQRMLGFRAQQLLGEGWWNLTRRSEEERSMARAHVASLIDQKTDMLPVSFERALRTAAGDTKWILWNMSQGPEGSLLSIGYEITDRKMAEQRLQEKNKELQARNTEMLASIQYARRIQEAVLPDPQGLKKYFADAFVYYQPRDVVSGDFYWYYQRGTKVFVAAIDCTGHGVPGALMSVIANGLVRDVVIKRGIDEPAAILYALDHEMEAALSKEDGRTTPDGMDIALCVFDTEKKILSFAGAFRPLIRVRNNEITEFRGSRYPIGFYPEIVKDFEQFEVPYESGDAFYTFSDGYIDQFGGEKGKKLNRKRFIELLLEAQSMTMEEQEAFLDYALNNWKQEEEQTDDVLVIGVRI
jgi:PAS domain S-box-containing protein